MYSATRKKTESLLLARASTAALIAGSCFVTGALAQDDEIIVTGSRIPQANAIAASPVTTIGNVEFDIRGTTRVEDMVNTLPQAFAAQGSNTSNGATGTAQVSLRGLGANRTLVLIDGRRLSYGSPISSAPDLNQVPAALIERVEVLTGGASAAYGSDAIAGVVNFIMIDDFEGVRFDAQVSGYQHSNNDKDAQQRLANSSFNIPESNVFDGKGQDITFILGTNTADGRGNVTAYASYRNNDSIFQADRDYSACAYGGGDTATRPLGWACGGSATNINGTFVTNAGTFTLDETGPGNTLRPTDAFVNGLSVDLYNYAPVNYYQRPDERYSLGAFGHYEVNENLEFYTQLMMTHYRSDAQIAFSGSFFVPSQINCDNPLLSDAFIAVLPECGGLRTPGVTALLYPGKRLVEGGPRDSVFDTVMYRGVFGLRGALTEGWAYDTYFSYMQVSGNQQYRNDVSLTRLFRALDVVDVGGVPTCRSVVDGTDPACVPFNIFEIGGVDATQAAYLSVPSFQDGRVEQYVAEGVLTGDLGVHGIQSPYAEEGIGLALGFQWRKDALDYSPDVLFQTGDLVGQGGTAPPTFGVIETTDMFVEAQIPIVTGMEFAERLAFNGGYRHSDVSTSGTYSTWKLNGDWQVTPDIRIRGGWQRAARAANVIESFTPQASGLTVLSTLANGLSDPCAGATPIATLAQCANTGVTAAQYGSIPNSPAHQYNAVFGGNPSLDPEVSDTYTVGVVLTPQEYVPGNLILSVDYFSIDVQGYIGVITAQTSMDQCLATGDPAFCNLIHRAPNNGNLWINSANAFFTATNTNTGSLATSGLDINADWNFDFEEVGLGDIGGISMNLAATYLIDYDIQQLPGGVINQCAGFYGGICSNIASGGPNPQWRHRLRTTWQTPLEGFDATVSWRMFSSVDLFGGTTPTNLNRTLGSRHYIDLSASYNVTENWNVRVGVNNVMDKDPPLTSVTSGFQNGNTYPQTYDAQGRFLFLGTTIDF